MKCEECGEELDQKHVSYYLGKKVHPRCFERMKWRDNHLSYAEWVKLIKKRFEKPKDKRTTQQTK